jgi:hypothetical protein
MKWLLLAVCIVCIVLPLVGKGSDRRGVEK